MPEKRPTVYRANNLPTQGLPTWFAQLDTDKDGQVGLYEWKTAGRSLSDFQTWDLNGDGFITVEEAMHTFKMQQGTAVAAGGPSLPGAPSFGAPQGGPPQGFRGNNGGGGGGRQRRNRGGGAAAATGRTRILAIRIGGSDATGPERRRGTRFLRPRSGPVCFWVCLLN